MINKKIFQQTGNTRKLPQSIKGIYENPFVVSKCVM